MARLDRLQDAVYALDDAIDALGVLGVYSACDVDCLRDMRAQYQEEIGEINARREAADDADEAALTREYYMSR